MTVAHKIQKKHLKSLAVIASVTALIVISSTMAYFTSKDNTTNKFVGSRFDVMLLETKWDPEKAKNVIPGEELDKNPQVTNTERANCYVYLRVTVPCDTTMVDNDNGTPVDTAENANVPMYKFMIKNSDDTYVADESFSPKQLVNEHWQLIDSDSKGYTEFDSENKDYVYVYAYADGDTPTIVERNDITNPLFDKLLLWNFNEKFDKNKPHDVKVAALGIQTDIPANDIYGVWDILSGEVSG